MSDNVVVNEFLFSEKPTLENLRQMMESFASERDWNQFHTPRNLLLALVGEVGELSELFQWKGDVDESIINWQITERIHLGEELSDVLLYLIRLADKCGIDLPKAASYLLKAFNKGECKNDEDCLIDVSNGFSIHPNLEDIRKMASVYVLKYSPRNLLFAIVTAVGKISETCGWKSNTEILRGALRSSYGLIKEHRQGAFSKEFTPPFGVFQRVFFKFIYAQKDKIAEKFAALLLHLVQLAEQCSVDLPTVAFRKFNLNVEKYPVRLVKGSSKKYNEYENKTSELNIS